MELQILNKDYSSLLATIRHYSALFATIRTIRYSRLFAVRYLRLFAVRYSRLFAIRYSGYPDTLCNEANVSKLI